MFILSAGQRSDLTFIFSSAKEVLFFKENSLNLGFLLMDFVFKLSYRRLNFL